MKSPKKKERGTKAELRYPVDCRCKWAKDQTIWYCLNKRGVEVHFDFYPGASHIEILIFRRKLKRLLSLLKEICTNG